LQVIATVTQFLIDHGLTGKPVYFQGASSGGTLALKLPSKLHMLAEQGMGTEKQATVVDGNGTAGSGSSSSSSTFYLQVHGIIAGALRRVGGLHRRLIVGG
jgi:hypothetical protein